jgi:hypothetical protein
MYKGKVVMKKFIIGIVAVFCLQVGFMAFNAADRAGYLASNLPDHVQVEPLAQPYSRDSSYLLVAEDAGQYETDLPDTPDVIRPLLTDRRQVNPSYQRRPAKVTATAFQFQPVVITIPEQKPVEFTLKSEYAAVLATPPAESYDISSAEAPRRENKSGLSKAVKKPYEWLKALGSKVKDIR